MYYFNYCIKTVKVLLIFIIGLRCFLLVQTEISKFVFCLFFFF